MNYKITTHLNSVEVTEEQLSDKIDEFAEQGFLTIKVKQILE